LYSNPLPVTKIEAINPLDRFDRSDNSSSRSARSERTVGGSVLVHRVRTKQPTNDPALVGKLPSSSVPMVASPVKHPFEVDNSRNDGNNIAHDEKDTDPLLPQVNPDAVVADNSKANKSNAVAIASCILYSMCSVAMVLTNKGISTAVPREVKPDLPQFSIIIFQCLVAVVFVEAARLTKLIEYPSFNIQQAKPMIPLNALFIGMLLSGFLSLVYVSVPIVTVFKNLTNLATVAGDWYFFNEK
jgi:hypothetical protein